MSTWPPTLANLKVDMKIDPADTRDDAALTEQLNAAIDYVANQRKSDFQFDPTDVNQFSLPPVPERIFLGTMRLAARWFIRRRSPDGLVDQGDLGSSRIPGTDADIDRMLGIGRYVGMRFA